MEKILLIEDNAELRDNIEEILSLNNYKVLAAENGSLGLVTAQEKSPDLILCDVQLPDLNGFEVFSLIKNAETTAKTPFIFMTASIDKTEKCRGLELGAEDYITKPFTDRELISTINCRLKKNKEQKNSLELQKQKYVEELEELLTTLSHRLRSPVCSCLGLAKLLDPASKIEITPSDLEIIIGGIQSSSFQMNNFTEELSNQMQNYLVRHKTL